MLKMGCDYGCDIRLDHECYVCIICGKVDDSQILNETFSHAQASLGTNFKIIDLPNKFNENILNVLEYLKIPSEVSYNVGTFFEKIKSSNIGCSTWDIISYSILLATRNRGFQTSMYDIATATGTRIKTLMKIENLSKEFLPELCSDYNLHQFCALLDIGYKDMMKISGLIELDYKNNLINTCKPETICAGNIFNFLRNKKNKKITVKEFCAKIGVKESTLYRFLRNKK